MPLPQGACPEPLPDAMWEGKGEQWNIEVECSSISTKLPQVVKNLRKARRVGNGCLFVVPSRKDAERLVAGLRSQVPEAEPEREYVVLCFDPVLTRYPGPDNLPLPSIPKATHPPAPTSVAGASPPMGSISDEDRLREEVRRALDHLSADGKTQASGTEILSAVPTDIRPLLSAGTGTRPSSRLGRILAQEKVPCARGWDPKRRVMVRFYRLALRGTPPTRVDASASNSSEMELQREE